MNIKMISVFASVLLLTACAGAVTTQPVESATVSEFQSIVRQTTNAVNNTAPAFSDMNTCPPGMTRINHTAGGGGDAFIGTTEAGTEFSVNVNFGQGHQCQ